MKLPVAVMLMVCQIFGVMQIADAVTLGISKDGSSFTINEKPVYMIGISYYGAMTVTSPAFITKDLNDMKADGFNWIRVFACWDPSDMNVSVVDGGGAVREPYMSKLKALIRECNRRGIIVDVTMSRGGEPFPADQNQHLRCMQTLAKALKPYRNVYFDVGNERDIHDARYVSKEDMGALISAVKEIDPKRLCTASGVPSSRDDLAKYIRTGKCDFIAPHLGRDKDSPSQTLGKVTEFIGWMSDRSLPRVPILLQEPFRRDYNSYQPTEEDYFTDAAGAKTGGAAGWCLHNGSSGPNSLGEQRFRSFRMGDENGRRYDQLDTVERKVAHGLSEKIKELGSTIKKK